MIICQKQLAENFVSVLLLKTRHTPAPLRASSRSARSSTASRALTLYAAVPWLTCKDETYRATVIEPITHYAVLFPELNDAVKKRSTRLLDYDAARNRFRRAVDRPADDPAKLSKIEAELNAAHSAYEAANKKLLDVIPRVASLRREYLTPSLEALQALQLNWVSNAACQLDMLKVVAAGDNGALAKLGALQIVN